MKENTLATNFEPHECVIFVQSTKIGTHENKAIHSMCVFPFVSNDQPNFHLPSVLLKVAWWDFVHQIVSESCCNHTLIHKFRSTQLLHNICHRKGILRHASWTGMMWLVWLRHFYTFILNLTSLACMHDCSFRYWDMLMIEDFNWFVF